MGEAARRRVFGRMVEQRTIGGLPLSDRRMSTASAAHATMIAASPSISRLNPMGETWHNTRKCRRVERDYGGLRWGWDDDAGGSNAAAAAPRVVRWPHGA